MPILNYTTTISAEKTAGEIQSKLAKAKAQAVLCEYDDSGVMCAMSFRIMTKHGMIFFRMPANTEGVYNALRKSPKVPNKLKTRAQAANVAWRVLKDWIEAQLAIVEAEMADISEVFLPYAQGPDGRTLYKTLEDGGFKALTHSPEGRA
jgi:hypothetical protein